MQQGVSPDKLNIITKYSDRPLFKGSVHTNYKKTTYFPNSIKLCGEFYYYMPRFLDNLHHHSITKEVNRIEYIFIVHQSRNLSLDFSFVMLEALQYFKKSAAMCLPSNTQTMSPWLVRRP